MRGIAERRHNDWKKAVRKRSISRHAYGWDWYNELHMYSKGKIHCSCGMCRCKTNNKVCRRGASFGPVENWPLTDRRRIEEMADQMEEVRQNGGPSFFFLKNTVRGIYRPLSGR